MLKRPLIPVAFLYVAGLLLADLPVPLIALFAVAFALIPIFIIWPKSRMIVLGGLILLTGWVNLSQRRAILAPDDLRVLLGNEAHSVALRGVLRDTPAHRVRREAQSSVESWSSIAEIDVQEIRIGNENWRTTSG